MFLSMDFLSRFDGDQLIGLTAVAGSMLVVIILTLSCNWRKVREAEIAANLKKEMLEQGRSAEEIAQVLSGKMRSNPKC